jgi:hypothetical protein
MSSPRNTSVSAARVINFAIDLVEQREDKLLVSLVPKNERDFDTVAGIAKPMRSTCDNFRHRATVPFLTPEQAHYASSDQWLFTNYCFENRLSKL